MKKIFTIIMTIILVCSMTLIVSADNISKVQDCTNGVVRVICAYKDSEGKFHGSTGSAFAVGNKDEDVQYFITNNHVVRENINGVALIFDTIVDKDGESKLINAEVIFNTDSPDIAILKIDEPTSKRKALPLGSSKDMKITDTIYALGFPGLEDMVSDEGYNRPSSPKDVTVTKGTIIKEKTVIDGYNLLAIDALINHGNSGGPLINEKGEVVGVNTALSTDSDGNRGASYAVYIDYVINQLEMKEVPYYTPDTQNKKSINDYLIYIIIGGGVILIVLVVLTIVKKKQTPAKATVNVQQNAKNNATDMNTQIPQNNNHSTFTLVGIGGVYSGNSFTLNQNIIMGRNPSSCNLVYPQETKGISSIHCELRLNGNMIELIDKGSTYGTFLDNGTQLQPNVPYRLISGQRFYLADPSQMFLIQ